MLGGPQRLSGTERDTSPQFSIRSPDRPATKLLASGWTGYAAPQDTVTWNIGTVLKFERRVWVKQHATPSARTVGVADEIQTKTPPFNFRCVVAPVRSVRVVYFYHESFAEIQQTWHRSTWRLGLRVRLILKWILISESRTVVICIIIRATWWVFGTQRWICELYKWRAIPCAVQQLFAS